MSTEILPFNYQGVDVRFVADEAGNPEIVASDLAATLGYRMASDMTRTLDEDEKGTRLVRTPGGDQEVTTVSEAGMYRAIMQRQTGRMIDEARKTAVKAFQRWVTHEVLPAIRRTGRYGPRLSGRELLAAALLEADQVMKAQAAQIEAQQAELDTALPKADTWDKICSGAGDYTITDAAKVLARAGIATGPRKLHSQLLALGWIYKNQRGKWTAKQGRINDGCLAERARYYIDDDGVSALAAPQVRVTAKGLQTLREQLGAPELPQRRVTSQPVEEVTA